MAGLALVAGPAAWLLARPAAAAGSDALVTAAPAAPTHGAADAAVDRRGLMRGPRIRFEARSRPARAGRPAARAIPRAVAIPSVGLRAPVRPVGVDVRTHALQLPADPAAAGWYRFGPAPGEAGTAVLAAHVDWDGGPAAFFDLRRVSPGDRVVVESRRGRRAFEVVARARYGKGTLPPRLFARDGRAALALVTCAGTFDERTGTYSENLVIWAVPAG